MTDWGSRNAGRVTICGHPGSAGDMDPSFARSIRRYLFRLRARTLEGLRDWSRVLSRIVL
jgi:hypothetical protein